MKKSDMRYNELIQHYVDSSKMEIVIERDREGWKRLRFVITGELELLPIIKNRKQLRVVKGRAMMMTNKDAQAKIAALDILFRQHKSKIECYDGPCVVVILMSEKQRADRISIQESILDWFEPHTKPLGGHRKNKKRTERGWGIGIYTNDKDAIGMTFKQQDISYFWKGAEIWVIKESQILQGAFDYLRVSGGFDA